MLRPLYTPENCPVAYQLHWSLTLFASETWPHADSWRQTLGDVVEADGVRILEFKHRSQDAGQFLVSTKPQAAPAQIVRSIKGRKEKGVRNQYIKRFLAPFVFRRFSLVALAGDFRARLE